MPRSLKGTRIKGTPPKVQLRTKDAIPNPFLSHQSVFGQREVQSSDLAFNDNKTLLFNQYSGISWHDADGEGYGFNPASGSYTHYALNPSVDAGGNILFWWNCEEIASVTSSFYILDQTPDARHGEIVAVGNCNISNDVASYYNNNTSTYPNSSSIAISGLSNGAETIKVDGIDTELFRLHEPAGYINLTLSVHFAIDTLIDYTPLLWKGDKATSLSDWQFLIKSDGTIQFVAFNSTTGTYRIFQTPSGYAMDKAWHHLAITFSEVGYVYIYLDGEVLSVSVNDFGWTGFASTTNQIYLGALFDSVYVGGSRVCAGNFDNIVVANRMAKADEVEYLRLGAPVEGAPTVWTRGTGIVMPTGLLISDRSLYRTNQGGTQELNQEAITDLTVSGSIRKGIGDGFEPTLTENYRAFDDSGKPAVDGLSAGNAFYSTGSKVGDVGEGFDQPLWSKTKIEVDLTPSENHSFFIQNYTSSSNSYPMAYWNTSRKKWEGVGAGKEFGRYVAGNEAAFKAICEEQCIGFGNGMNQGGSGLEDYSIGAKISNFGFPYHVKYHATSSNVIQMSQYISEPFLLEKIVLEWSGSLKYNNTSFGTATNYSVATFFILNQRKPFGYDDPAVQRFVYRTVDGHTHTLITGALLPSSYGGGQEYNTIRELVTHAQVVGFSENVTEEQVRVGSRELNILSGSSISSGSFGAWRGRLVMSGTVKNSLPNDGLDTLQVGHNDSGMTAMMLINKNSTRSGLFTPGGRDFVGALEKGRVVTSYASLESGFPGSTDPTGSITVLDRYSKPNPYLLQPSDNLVFGWQLPVANRINSSFGTPQYNGQGTELTFASVPSKITFYGSLVRENQECHDTLNQLLTSTAIHEVIE